MMFPRISVNLLQGVQWHDTIYTLHVCEPHSTHDPICELYELRYTYMENVMNGPGL
jgi:hypothetical protein